MILDEAYRRRSGEYALINACCLGSDRLDDATLESVRTDITEYIKTELMPWISGNKEEAAPVYRGLDWTNPDSVTEYYERSVASARRAREVKRLNEEQE